MDNDTFARTVVAVLTIVYDDQPDMTWPAAGSPDDAALPDSESKMSQFLYRIVHICCHYRQTWYQLLNDGLERIQEAG